MFHLWSLFLSELHMIYLLKNSLAWWWPKMAKMVRRLKAKIKQQQFRWICVSFAISPKPPELNFLSLPTITPICWTSPWLFSLCQFCIKGPQFLTTTFSIDKWVSASKKQIWCNASSDSLLIEAGQKDNWYLHLNEVKWFYFVEETLAVERFGELCKWSS